MKINPRKINTFMMLKLPLAWLGGVRVKSISETSCIVNIKHRWMNQNPFKSMFWAAQGMAAEMTTGALVLQGISDSGRKVSMLVLQQKGVFTKKATGKIRFECNDGSLVKEAIEKSSITGEGETVIMKSIGYNSENIPVSNFEFEWTLKVKA
ncbi:DUF4442 domain-containing protein [Pseudotenacibaculum sp. MALMAid0570]|uniref:DUF4442 domain-containing protein n=1 Tax=Pseudotenacibaculum sp. MALMAid0570 TaxID=3143938 RepID=UPI0032DE95F5